MRSVDVAPNIIIQDSGDSHYTNNLLVGTAATGNVRVEWVAARYSQLIPINWSLSAMMQVMGGYYPLRYLVADAQNLIVREAIRGNYEYLLLLEHDVVLQVDAFTKFNKYMRARKAPVVSGLYFGRSYPSEPMAFRGRGNGVYGGWKLGDVIEVDGVPTGCLLVHMSLMKAMYEDSEEYTLSGVKVRRVFDTPRETWVNPETGECSINSSTSDLDWCTRVISGDYLRRAGCPEYADKQWPFILDTDIYCTHIEPDGRVYPDKQSLKQWERD